MVRFAKLTIKSSDIFLIICFALLAAYYFNFRSFDLDGDGMRSTMLAFHWHDSVNVSDPTYGFRYWPSEILLDLIVFFALKIKHSFDFLRSFSYFIAVFVSLVCSLILRRFAGNRPAILFAIFMWLVPVAWAESSYTVGITTVNFWLSCLSSTMLAGFFLTRRSLYLNLFCVIVGIDLLHIYPSSVIIHASELFALLVFLILNRKIIDSFVRHLLLGIIILLGVYFLGGAVAGFLVADDWTAYFKLLPFFLRFYFVTRASETAAQFTSSHPLDEVRWLLFGGTHAFPPNEECEMPMAVPDLAMLPGLIIAAAFIFLAQQTIRDRKLPVYGLLALPLIVFYVALINTMTSQRHYMPTVVATTIFAALAFDDFLHRLSRVKIAEVAIYFSLVILIAINISSVESLKKRGFGAIDTSVWYGRQAGNARQLADVQEYLSQHANIHANMMVSDNFRTLPQLLGPEFLEASFRRDQIVTFRVVDHLNVTADMIRNLSATEVLIFFNAVDQEQILSSLAEGGVTVKRSWQQLNRVVILGSKSRS